MGFFKGREKRTKSNSPYVIHKVRTQDIRPPNKVYGTMRDTKTKWHNDNTQTLIGLEQKKEPSLDRIIGKADRTNAKPFYKAPQKPLKRDLEKQYDTIPTSLLNATLNADGPKSFRRGRFEIALPADPLIERKASSSSSSESEKVEKIEESTETLQPQKKAVPRLASFDLRKRTYNKTIDAINRGFLSQTDSYIGRALGE